MADATIEESLKDQVMTTRILADNWTLQNAGEFIHGGLDGEDANELIVPEEGDSFGYGKVPADLIRFDALCQFLNHLVIADEVWVDGHYTATWEKFSSLSIAKEEKVVVPKAFRELQDQWIKAREAMGDQLCVNKALRKAHRKNKREWAKKGTVVDGVLSQLIWGGAGMLARADHFKLPYAPHPQRERLFRRARFMQGADAGAKLEEFVTSERLKIYRQIGKAGFMGKIHLPPIAVQIIQESKGLPDVVPTALQLRDEYKKVRAWLGQLQRDLSHEKVKDVLKHMKRLQSVSRHLDSYSAVAPPGDTTVQFGISWLKIGAKGGSPVNAVRNLFGMRAEVNRLVLNPAGMQAMPKLLRMLGEQHTKKGRRLKEALERRAAEQAS